MRTMEKCRSAELYKWMFFISSALIPVAITSYYYSQNVEQVLFRYILLICVFEMVFSIILYYSARAIFQSFLSAIAICIIFWIIFFSYNELRALFCDLLDREVHGLPISISIFIIIAIVIGIVLRKHEAADDVVAVFLFTVILALLSMNSARIIIRNTEQKKIAIATSADYRTDFEVNRQESPNIYWIHCDGMLGFDTVNKYFHDEQAAFNAALNERGFALNKNAYLESLHITYVAIPSMMSPDYYDDTLKEIIQSGKDRTAVGSSKNVVEARRNLELFTAFRLKGYRIKIVCTYPGVFFPEGTDFFLFSDYINRTTDSIYLQSCTLPSNQVSRGASDVQKIKEQIQYEAFLETFAKPAFIIFEMLHGADKDTQH